MSEKTPKKPFHEQLAEKLIEQLKEGKAPWQVPWTSINKVLPYNAQTGNSYRGSNSLMLLMSGYEDPRWLTFNQAKAEGYKVKKGSTGIMLTSYRNTTEAVKRDENGQPVKDANGQIVTEKKALERAIINNFYVYNAEQIEGIAPLPQEKLSLTWDPIDRIEQIVKNSQAVIEHEPGNKAYYLQSKDKIVLPLKEQFDSPGKYYSTLMHELGHWTSHSSRLDRDLSAGSNNKEEYAREELRAEISSMILGNKLGVQYDSGQHLDYIDYYIKILTEDPKELLKACQDAEKIQMYIMEFDPYKSVDLTVDPVKSPTTENKPAAEQEGPNNREQTLVELKTQFNQTMDNLTIQDKNHYAATEIGMNMILKSLPDSMKEQAQIEFYKNSIHTMKAHETVQTKQPIEASEPKQFELEI